MSYTYRFAGRADFSGYFDLYKGEVSQSFGACYAAAEDVEGEWSAPGFDPEQMMVLAFPDGDSGHPIGYVEVRAHHDPPVRLYGYGYVAPAHRGRGVGSELVRRAEEVARLYFDRTPPGARVVLQSFSDRDDGREMLRNAGYVETREALFMTIEFNEPPAAPQWPEGFYVKTMADGLSLEQLVAIKEETFRDHRGSVEQTLDAAVATWKHMIETSKRYYDPALFVALYDGDKPAGQTVLWTESEEDPSLAFVQSLGVMPDYRRRGLGTMLLRYGFAEAHKRGRRGVRLNVDGSSLTGANRMYERAGMYVSQRFTAFEKEMRAGVELSRQS